MVSCNVIRRFCIYFFLFYAINYLRVEYCYESVKFSRRHKNGAIDVRNVAIKSLFQQILAILTPMAAFKRRGKNDTFGNTDYNHFVP